MISKCMGSAEEKNFIAELNEGVECLRQCANKSNDPDVWFTMVKAIAAIRESQPLQDLPCASMLAIEDIYQHAKMRYPQDEDFGQDAEIMDRILGYVVDNGGTVSDYEYRKRRERMYDESPE